MKIIFIRKEWSFSKNAYLVRLFKIIEILVSSFDVLPDKEFRRMKL